jgi:OmpR family response regulator RpaB
MMPKLDGMSVCQQLRTHSDVPIIMLTAVSEIANRVTALELGADDYLVKPFSPKELEARIRCVLRRSQRPQGPDGVIQTSTVIEVAGLKVDINKRQVFKEEERVRLTGMEFSMLELLMRYNGQVVTRKMLCEHVWGFDWDGPTNVIEVHINRLRGKLDKGRGDSAIRTIRGRGYALAAG